MKKKPDLLPKKALTGTVCAQMVRCGKATCKCAIGKLHGPYHYYFSRDNGSLTKRYIRKADVQQTRAACNSRGAQETQIRRLIQTNQQLFGSLIAEVRKGELLVLRYREGINEQKPKQKK